MEWIVALAALVVGAGIGWLVRRQSKGGGAEADLRSFENRLSASDARIDELRHQLEESDREKNEIQEKLSAAEKARATAEATTVETQKNLAEQRTLLDEAKAKLSETFKSLASDALAHSNRGFLTLAEEKFKALKDEAATDLDVRKTKIQELVDPLKKALDEYQKEAKELEAKRLKEISTVGEQLRSVAETQASLQQETSKLVNALRSPQVRGRWGEIALRKTAELAGMTEHCDFIEQESVSTEDGRLRPDMVVKLPAGREVVVDSKVPLGGFMDALECTSDDERKACLVRHATQLKSHVQKLSSKEYWNQFPTAPEFVVLFIPNDSFLAAAAEQDPALVESALQKQVVIATPTTFIALLRAIAFGWRQEAMTRNAIEISKLGRDLSDRLATLTAHLSQVGKSIERTVQSYNKAVGSLETRVIPSARRFKELGVEGKKKLEQVDPVDHVPRQLAAPDDGDSDALPEK
jgi:DNA recombination protein RmuC